MKDFLLPSRVFATVNAYRGVSRLARTARRQSFTRAQDSLTHQDFPRATRARHVRYAVLARSPGPGSAHRFLLQELPVQPLITPYAASQSDRQTWLSTQLATQVTLIWTENKASMLSARGSKATGYVVRLHAIFLPAPAEVWHALVAYLHRTGPQAARTIRDYIRQQQHRLVPPPVTRANVLQPCGQHFDLEAIYRDLNQHYFVERVQAEITWSRRPLQRQRTSMRFGSYHERDRLIRVHRLLDQPFVPRYVVENVVFHEMLHQLIPRQYRNGRWSIHPPEFRQQEQRFEYYQQAEQWQRLHLGRLLRG